MKRLVRYFFQGILFITPTALTIYIVYIIFTYVDGYIQSFLEQLVPWRIPGLGILAILVIITLVGFIAGSIIFSPISKFFDTIMKRAPLVKVLYSSIKDLLSAFVGQEKKFDKPVLVKVNTISELEKMGFLTTEDLSELNIKDKVAVYFPHSYNFSGEMFIVPTKHITPLNIPASEAMKFIVSGGVTKV